MKRIIRNYNEDDAMSKILLLYFAFQHAAIGIFFMFSTEQLLAYNSFKGMNELLPMDAWGIILLMSAVCFLLSTLFENKVQYYFMMVAGATGMVTFGLLAMASIELSTNQTNTINYIIIASIDIIIAIIGGIAVWLRKTS